MWSVAADWDAQRVLLLIHLNSREIVSNKLSIPLSKGEIAETAKNLKKFEHSLIPKAETVENCQKILGHAPKYSRNLSIPLFLGRKLLKTAKKS